MEHELCVKQQRKKDSEKYIHIYPWQFIKVDRWVRFPGASNLKANYYFPSKYICSRGRLHPDLDVHAVPLLAVSNNECQL